MGYLIVLNITLRVSIKAFIVLLCRYYSVLDKLDSHSCNSVDLILIITTVGIQSAQNGLKLDISTAAPVSLRGHPDWFCENNFNVLGFFACFVFNFTTIRVKSQVSTLREKIKIINQYIFSADFRIVCQPGQFIKQ